MRKEDYFSAMKNTLDIVREKYIHLSVGVLRTYCSKYNIEFGYGETKENLIFYIIPRSLQDVDYLKHYYTLLKPKEQKILKFIVNYNGAGLRMAVKNKFKFDILSLKKSPCDLYIWWLDLFIYDDGMDRSIQSFFLTFLADENKKILEEKKKLIKTTADISTITIDKVTLDYEQIVQNLFVETPMEIATSVRVIYHLAKENKIKVTKKGELSVRSIRLLDAHLAIDYMNYTWLLNFFIKHKYLSMTQEKIPTKSFNTLVNSDDGTLMKTIFTKFQNQKMQQEFDFIPFSITAREGSGIKTFRTSVIKIIKEIKSNEWINIDYIVDQVAITPQTLKQLTNNYQYCYQFISSSKNYYDSYNRIENLKVVVRFFIKSFVGIMHRFGLCSIAKTQYESYCLEDMKDLNVPYDIEYTTLEYFKLSSLGLFVLDIEDKFIDENDFTLMLNDYKYEIEVDKPSPRAEIFLSHIADKVSDTKYQTDIKIFMNSIDSKENYDSTKKLFMSKCTSIPPNWKQLFETISNRISTANIISSTAILIQISNAKEILHIISSNPRLREKILKADKMHIVVPEENLTYVKKVFKEYGVIL